MGEVTITDPDEYRTNAPVDSRGRVNIGTEYAGQNVTIVVETNEDES